MVPDQEVLVPDLVVRELDQVCVRLSLVDKSIICNILDKISSSFRWVWRKWFRLGRPWLWRIWFRIRWFWNRLRLVLTYKLD